MKRQLLAALLPLVIGTGLAGCSGVSFDVASRVPEPGRAPDPDSVPEPDHRPSRPPPRNPEPARKGAPVRKGHGPYAHLPQRKSFSPKASVDLKEGCYAGDFVLGSSQIRVKGAGIGKTVIHGNLVLQTQCTVSCLTVTGDVIFEGHQAELEDADFFGEVIDKGSQNSY